jgi:hypothetical protein
LLWWNSLDTQLYLYYADPNSSQWVVANNQSGFVPEAPLDGQLYGRKTGDWSILPTGTITEAPNDGYAYERRSAAWSRAATPDVGRNVIHNPVYTVAQRGNGPWTVNGAFTADRWWIGFTAPDTLSASLVSLTDADRSQIGDESAQTGHQSVFVGNAAAGAFSSLTQSIENVRRLANKVATVSFWAKAATGSPTLGVTWYQNFGSGGSPSAIVLGTGAGVVLSTTWTRYSRTFTIPSISGKVLGTNGDHHTALRLGFSSGASNATFLGVGVQSGTISLWGIQLELGGVATPLDYGGSPQQVLQQCQRFYQTGQVIFNQYAGAAGNAIGASVPFPVTMRAAPTVAYGAVIGADTNVGAAQGPDVVSAAGFRIYAPATAAGAVQLGRNWTASADL